MNRDKIGVDDERFSEEEVASRYRATLASVLATPPDHKTDARSGASPKKRGRPPKKQNNDTVEWRAFCKSEDLKEIASARFGRLAILAHAEGLLTPILAGERESVRTRAFELSETLLKGNLYDDHQILEATCNESSIEGFEQLSAKLYALFDSSR